MEATRARRRFHLVRRLGSGTFGTVYLAELESAGGFRKEVAIKVLNPEMEGVAEAGRRLRDEARVLGRLRHRNIVRVDDLVRLDGRWALVMEYVPGADLEVLLGKSGGGLPVAAALEIVAEVAAALEAAWNGTPGASSAPRVLHRDIKPSNLRLTASGELKVLDFGIARAEQAERESRTGHHRLGSLWYMGPERLLGGQDGPEGDVYALGCVLVELITGQPVGHTSIDPALHERTVGAALERLAGALAARDPALQEPVLELARRCLAHAAADRPFADEFMRRARELALDASGLDMASYAAGHVPHGEDGEPARGTLIEATSDGSTSPPRAPSSSSGSDTFALPTGSTLAVSDDDLEAELAPVRLAPTPAPKSPGPGTLVPRSDTLPPEVATGPGPWPWVALTVALGVLGIWFVVGRLRSEEGQAPTAAVALDPAPSAAPALDPALDPGPAPDPAVGLTAASPPSEPPPADPPPQVAEGEPVTAEPATPSSPTTAPLPAASTASDPGAAAGARPSQSSPERLRAVKVVVEGASAVSVTCGDRSASGSGSALVREAPAGPCDVVATLADGTARGAVQVDAARGYTCAAAPEGGLSCR